MFALALEGDGGMVGEKLGSDCSDVCALELVREFFRYVFFRYVFFLDKTF